MDVQNALIQINNIDKNILQLEIQDYQEKSKLSNEFKQQLKALISEINKWKTPLETNRVCKCVFLN